MAYSSLGKRVISAAVVLPLVLWLVMTGGFVLYAGLLLVAGLALYEFWSIVRSAGARPAPEVLFGGAFGFLTLAYLGASDQVGGWLVVVLVYALLRNLVSPQRKLSNAALGVLGSVYIGWFLAHVYLLRESGPSTGPGVLLVVLLGTWAYDTGAYFVGGRLGRTKLLPNVSPGKSLEGLFGGLFFALLVSWLARSLARIPTLLSLALGLVVALAAQAGDFAESAAKREARLKDSGRVLPGHGGLLDRIDSLLFTAPAAYYLVGLLL